jgi:Phosphotransferase enzyme family
MTIDQSEESARQNQAIIAWVERNMGARVTGIRRQRRWRPVWRVDAEKDGLAMPLLFKGTRAWDDIPFPLENEYRVLQVLEANGIPVPPLHGLCDDPKAIVMSWVKGGRDPGLVVEALENKSTITPDRWQASLRYMEVLAQMHSIDPAKFVAVGCEMPVGAAAKQLNLYERFHKMYEDKKLDDPFIEFCTLWLRRNVPKHQAHVSFATGDCGQFLSDGPNLTAVIDMEVGHLADHFADLACFRGRHPVENMGDVRALFDHYAKALGQPLDLDAIAYQTVVFLVYALFTPLFALAEPTPGGDWVEGAIQVAFIGRRAAEAMAEILGVKLNDEFQLPAPRPTPLEDLALNKLIFEIDRLPLSETLADWQRSTIASVPRYLRNQLHYGVWVQEQELDELVEILGSRPADVVDADKKLADFVRQAGPELDTQLLKLFYRRLLRLCHVIAGPDPAPDHLVLMKVEPILKHATIRESN